LYLLRHHKGENPSYGDPQSTQAPLSDVSTRVRNNCMIHQGLNHTYLKEETNLKFQLHSSQSV